MAKRKTYYGIVWWGRRRGPKPNSFYTSINSVMKDAGALTEKGTQNVRVYGYYSRAAAQESNIADTPDFVLWPA